MALRLLTRSALRRCPTVSAFRVSTSAFSRLAVCQLSGAKQPVEVRSFSTEDDSSSAADHLADMLAREIEEEEENETVIPPDELSDLKSQLDDEWRIVEGMPGEDGSTVKMFKKDTSAGKISIVFHCQDGVNVEVDSDEGEEEPTAPVRFTVTVTKAGKTMIITCLSEDAEAIVQSVVMSGADGDPEKVAIDGIDSTLYQGPEFAELAPDVQEAFSDYIQTDCGVDADVAAFIAMYSDFREQVEYVSWLKNVKSIL